MTTENETIKKLAAERLLLRVLRYHKLVYMNAPNMIIARELELISKALCKPIHIYEQGSISDDERKEFDRIGHKEFIDDWIVQRFAKDFDIFYTGKDIDYALNGTTNMVLENMRWRSGELVAWDKYWNENEKLPYDDEEE